MISKSKDQLLLPRPNFRFPPVSTLISFRPTSSTLLTHIKMASLATNDAPTAREFAAAQTRRRRSASGGGETVGRVVSGSETSVGGPSEVIATTAVPRLQGNFSGCGGAVGVSIRIEMVYNDAGDRVHLWVWSNATECFDIPDVPVEVNEDKTIKFGPIMMKTLLEKTVVTKIFAAWDAEKDTIKVKVTIKLGRFVPSFDLNTNCVGVDVVVGAVSGDFTKRKRPY